MGHFEITLLTATLFCSLVAGFVFGFAVVVMPGIRSLGDGEFLRAFQVIDRVIQNNQPLFLVVWVGSAVALVASAAFGFGRLEGSDRLLLLGSTVVYLLGVQGPTIAFNIPLNNAVQALDIETMDSAARARARHDFESRWNFWNSSRTVAASLVTAVLLVVLLKL